MERILLSSLIWLLVPQEGQAGLGAHLGLTLEKNKVALGVQKDMAAVTISKSDLYTLIPTEQDCRRREPRRRLACQLHRTELLSLLPRREKRHSVPELEPISKGSWVDSLARMTPFLGNAMLAKDDEKIFVNEKKTFGH